jgi:hypothetical protein
VAGKSKVAGNPGGSLRAGSRIIVTLLKVARRPAPSAAPEAPAAPVAPEAL